jgi:hypothetical protein
LGGEREGGEGGKEEGEGWELHCGGRLVVWLVWRCFFLIRRACGRVRDCFAFWVGEKIWVV